MRPAALVLAGVVVCCTAVACEAAAPPPVTGTLSPGPAATAASGTECVNAPSALVGKDLGLQVGKLTAIDEGPVTVCAYAGRYEVIVRYQDGESSSAFAQARQSQASLHQSVSTVPGLGEAAYLARYPASNTLGSLDGDIAIFITSPASLGAERTLMADLLKKT
jgi:hypothetical protein